MESITVRAKDINGDQHTGVYDGILRGPADGTFQIPVGKFSSRWMEIVGAPKGVLEEMLKDLKVKFEAEKAKLGKEFRNDLPIQDRIAAVEEAIKRIASGGSGNPPPPPAPNQDAGNLLAHDVKTSLDKVKNCKDSAVLAAWLDGEKSNTSPRPAVVKAIEEAIQALK